MVCKHHHLKKFRNSCRKDAKVSSTAGIWQTYRLIVALTLDRIGITSLLFRSGQGVTVFELGCIGPQPSDHPLKCFTRIRLWHGKRGPCWGLTSPGQLLALTTVQWSGQGRGPACYPAPAALWGPWEDFLWSCYQNSPDHHLFLSNSAHVLCNWTYFPLSSAIRKCQNKHVPAKTVANAFYSEPSGCIWLFIFPLLHLKIHIIYDLTILCILYKLLLVLSGTKHT